MKQINQNTRILCVCIVNRDEKVVNHRTLNQIIQSILYICFQRAKIAMTEVII